MHIGATDQIILRYVNMAFLFLVYNDKNTPSVVTSHCHPICPIEPFVADSAYWQWQHDLLKQLDLQLVVLEWIELSCGCYVNVSGAVNRCPGPSAVQTAQSILGYVSVTFPALLQVSEFFSHCQHAVDLQIWFVWT